MNYNADLEAAIREDPDDEARWSVLEDWILEQDDARALLVRLSKAGDRDAALKVTWEIARVLFGDDPFSGMYAATAGCQWRAGYIDHGYFESSASSRMDLLQRFLAMRETSLMRQLRITIDQASELRILVHCLASGTCKQSLRRLIVAAYWKPPTQQVTFDASSLAPFMLDELRFYDRAIRIEYAEPLARLRRLAFAPGATDDLLLFRDPFPALRELDLDLRTLEARGWQRPDAIDHAFACPIEKATLYVGEPMFSAIRERAPSGLDLQRR